MKFNTIIYFCLFLFLTFPAAASEEAPPLFTISGQVTSKGIPLPYASIQIKSSSIGTSSAADGSFKLDVPPGDFQLRAQALGYKPLEMSVNSSSKKIVLLDLEEDALLLEQIVVTADRNAHKRTESSVIVNTLDANMFARLQSNSLSEGLAFCPGLRIENTCGNCGSNQLRMNGLDGPYSQILINGKPIFSGLASVYGLELMPANMIDRVEVVRGGGSALYGSNAIAGTVNVITREPINNQYELFLNSSMVGVGNNAQPENSLQFNTTLTSEDRKQGLALYGFQRHRSPYDANDDGFSELAKIRNTTVGLHYSLKPGLKSKITADYFHINEMRRGGDSFDIPMHETLITEATDHRINSANLSYHLFTKADQELTVYLASQTVDRDSYYGADRALDAYGITTDLTYSAGSQYKIASNLNTIIVGAEIDGGELKDKKLAYRTYELNANTQEVETIYHDNREVANQNNTVGGLFGQWERKVGAFSLSGGLRMDYYSIENKMALNPKLTNTVLSPRLNILYGLNKNFQARASYSKGYRAPQVFDEDLHVETSVARQVIHINDPNLEQETSNSYMASFSYQMEGASNNLELLAEFFYTDLQNPFANEIGLPDADGVVTYTRVNEKEGAVVKGVNLEATWIPSSKWRLNGSYTFQNSRYGAPQDFDEKHFLRTPDQYGYFMLEWKPTSKISLNTNSVYTGKMLVPYFGPTLDIPEEGEIRQSKEFFDWSFKADYTFKTKLGNFQLIAGVKNILNSYQNDFDKGGDRDPGYVYGPKSPRTVHVGIKINDFF